MTGKSGLDPTTLDTTDWNNAWDTVRRIAAARRHALTDVKEDSPRAVAEIGATLAPQSSEHQTSHTQTIDTDHYARAIAEIEQASATLRRAEPALEAWLPNAMTQSEPRHPRSIWILIGGIWISTVLIVTCAIAAALFLLG